MTTETIDPHLVKRQIPALLWDLLADVRLKACRQLKFKPEVDQAFAQGSGTVRQVGSEGTEIVVTVAELKVALDRLLNIVRLPLHLAESWSQLRAEQFVLRDKSFIKDVADCDVVVASVVAWILTGKRIRCVENDLTREVPADAWEFESLPLKDDHFVLRTSRQFCFDSPEGSLVGDTFLVNLLPGQLNIRVLLRPEEACVIPLVPEKIFRDQVRAALRGKEVRRAERLLLEQTQLLRERYVGWLPGVLLSYRGTYNEGVFRPHNPSELGLSPGSDRLVRVLGQTQLAEMAVRCLNLAIVALQEYAERKPPPVTPSARERPPNRRRTAQQIATTLLEPDPEAALAVSYVPREEGRKGKNHNYPVERKQTEPHPRRLPAQTKADGTLVPARIVPVNGWKLEIHGPGKGQLTVSKKK